MVLPHGALFRMGVEGDIRHKSREMDILEAVIGLGPNLFYGTGLAACILVFRAHKLAEHRERVLFLDASRLFKKGRNQNTLTPEHIDEIFTMYKNYRDEAGIARLVPLEKIAQSGWNLNIPRYVEPIAKEETISTTEAIANLKTALEEAYAAEDQLKALLQESGFITGETSN